MKYGSDNSKLSTREVILDAIKQSNEATVESLAVAADVSPVTVRHHLNSLQAESLLQTRSVRRKVGRPYYVYSLSDKGHELFPQRYMSLSSRLLDELKARFPSGTVDELFNGVVHQIVEDNRKDFEGLSVERRLDFLVKLLAEEGFLASWELSGGKYVLTEYSCPYFSVGQRHDEVCTLDRQLVQIILDTEVEQESCMLHGDSQCQFTFSMPVVAS
ncbi:MAG TPA: DeoR family transcriptional regulator [candidate division Zixibacteria bacterium]|nr:DeoR family transcriptional regulator [candidate division Zixibacteria bacterium]